MFGILPSLSRTKITGRDFDILLWLARIPGSRRALYLAGMAVAILALIPPASAQVWYLTGKVVMEDGSPPPKPVGVERYCNPGQLTFVARTDRKGQYLVRNMASDVYSVLTSSFAVNTENYGACVLRAMLSGYDSTTVDLTSRAAGDPHLAPLILTRRTSDPNLNINTKTRAPQGAQKAWELAMKALQAKNSAEVERQLRAAVRAAPQFAEAWSVLGMVCQNQKKGDEARDAYERAISLDPKSLPAYLMLTRLDLDLNDWQGAAKASEDLIKADTRHRFPEAYVQNAAARYHLRDLEGAEASVREAIRLDPKRRNPRSDYVLGTILAAKRDYAGAAEHMLTYLELEPKAADAAAVQARIANLGKPGATEFDELKLDSSDSHLPVAGEAWVPGGMKAFAAAAHINGTPSDQNLFAEYCRALVWNTSRHEGPRVPAYLPSLLAYFTAIGELARAGEQKDGKAVVSLSLTGDTQRINAERVLPLLGWMLVSTEGETKVEAGDHAPDGLRQQIPGALGIDAVAMQEALDAGHSFSFEVPTDTVRLIGGDAWGELLVGQPAFAGGIAEAFARDLRFARTYAGLSALGADTAAAVVSGVGLRNLVQRYSDVLVLYADAFAISNGKVVTPGGAAAEKVWAQLAGASASDPPAFFRGLFGRDRGKLAAYYFAVSRGDEEHQRFFTSAPGRAERFYAWYRDSNELKLGAEKPLGTWQAAFFQNLPLDEAGNVRYPGGKKAWTSSTAPDEEVLPALETAETLIRAAQLEQERKAPLDEASAALLARYYTVWRPIFPYVEKLPGLGHSEFQAFAAYTDAIAGYPPPKQNVALGEWYSLTELLALGVKAGSLDPQESARAFKQICAAAMAPDHSTKAVQALREMAGGAQDLDEAVPNRLLRLTGERRAAFDRIRTLQGVPRLDALAGSRDDTKTLHALSGLVYAAWLDPNGLLISEDPLVLNKHRFVDEGPLARFRPLFFASTLQPVSSPPGSYLLGGFMHFEDTVRMLAPGRKIVAPESGEPRQDPIPVAAPAGTVTEPPFTPEHVFRADARLVEVYATVTDARGHYIDGLPGDQFTVLEEGKPKETTAFESHFAAVSVALVLDTTASMQAALPSLKNAAVKLIGELRPEDSLAVYSFNETISELQPFTTDKSAAKRSVLGTAAFGDTALYDALVQVNRDLSGRSGKKVIVVFTDGDDNRSTLTADIATLRAKMAGVPVYTIAQGEALTNPALLKQLATISRATGGLPYTIQGPGQIRTVFESIAKDLMHGYLFAFRPDLSNEHRWRSIEVQIRGGKGYRVRAREGYYPE